jgi:flagellar basal-body rod modification protein FlgD
MMINNTHMLDANSGTNGASNSSQTGGAGTMGGINANDFMTLLVAEIQNQDPTKPMDPTVFMSQLVNLNQLEQVMQINQVVQQFGGTPAA